MATIRYDKLVRDAIPVIITKDNQTPTVRILDAEEYKQRLLEKLVEEARELLASGGDITERADVAEVLKSLDEAWGFSPLTVEAEREAKAAKKGGFSQRIFLEEVETCD